MMSQTTDREPRWQDFAKCKGLPPGKFVPSERGGSPDRIEKIRAICWGWDDGIECPVRLECKEAGEANNELGVWGGEMRSTKDYLSNTTQVVIKLQDGRLKKA